MTPALSDPLLISYSIATSAKVVKKWLDSLVEGIIEAKSCRVLRTWVYSTPFKVLSSPSALK
jgi:hypothetical protein